MTKAAKPDDAGLLTRSDLPMSQRRIGGDAGAEQWRHAGQIELAGNPQHESLVDDDRVGIAPVGRAADHFVDAVVGWVEAPFAILFQALAAGTASAAGIDHAADSGEVARLETGRFGRRSWLPGRQFHVPVGKGRPCCAIRCVPDEGRNGKRRNREFRSPRPSVRGRGG